MRLFQRLFASVPRVVLLMGGPGTGKSLQARMLPEFVHVSTGKLLRASPAGFQNMIQAGDLVPDEAVMHLVRQHEAFKSGSKPILLDGFPRTFAQWNLFKRCFGKPEAVIDLRFAA